MGCGQSKMPQGDGGAAVAMCRDRTALLAEAIRCRYALADAHRAYAASLRDAGAALHDFLRGVQALPPAPSSEPAAALRLPEQRKGDDSLPAAVPLPVDAAKQVDDDGGHIHFPSDDDDEGSDGGGHIRFPSDDDAEPPLPRPAAAPAPPQAAPTPYSFAQPYGYGPEGQYEYGVDMGGYGHSFFSISYARSQPPPPFVTSYEHRPQTANATVHYYPGDGAAGPPLPGSYYGAYLQGSGSTPQVSASAREGAAPPSPPRVSAWDFFNLFDSFESYYQEQPSAPPPAAYTPSRSSKDVREEEDIPELEHDEVDKVDNHDANGRPAKEETSSSAASASGELHRKSKSSEASSSSSSMMISEVHVVQKSVMEEQLQRSDAAAGPPAVTGKAYNDDAEVVEEIMSQFENAAKSAVDVSKVLVVGKMPYYHKSSGLKVSSMMICGLISVGEEFLQFEEDKAMECGNLSSTLQKLFMWEKKLLEEVKTEEKMRVLYDQKREELKVLYERGAEAHKLEAAEIHIRKLSTKISIAIQVVNTISKNINNLRDEELWPQTCELIQGLKQMWHAMSKCHQIQCHALSQAKNLDSKLADARFSEAHMDLIKRLELQLLELISSFAAWVNAQKSFLGNLNEWLKKGIDYVPEVTDDGAPPFSPGRLGAPPVFIICNNWAISMGRISEKEVVDTMQAFASSVLHLWEKHRLEWRQGMMANKDMDRDLRVMERDELLMRKALDAQSKKLVLVSNQSGVSLSAQVVHNNGPTAEVGLQSCMNKVFEAMESFTAACANAYNDLHLRSEEEKTLLGQDSGRVS
ncbi:hypothetical protein E2562_007192 [Oryza meyeriana var. granulata]|uniref:DUF632 domain-containing protein n=1 Tax=Oryza meyeriana var. granulata TaxID=110450 RepID=A0A6G1CDU1_9ORYZ|nr:hypothetical protein E2562_007192 [Oryza meyeriana var. granulata]